MSAAEEDLPSSFFTVSQEHSMAAAQRPHQHQTQPPYHQFTSNQVPPAAIHSPFFSGPQNAQPPPTEPVGKPGTGHFSPIPHVMNHQVAQLGQFPPAYHPSYPGQALQHVPAHQPFLTRPEQVPLSPSLGASPTQSNPMVLDEDSYSSSPTLPQGGTAMQPLAKRANKQTTPERPRAPEPTQTLDNKEFPLLEMWVQRQKTGNDTLTNEIMYLIFNVLFVEGKGTEPFNLDVQPTNVFLRCGFTTGTVSIHRIFFGTDEIKVELEKWKEFIQTGEAGAINISISIPEQSCARPDTAEPKKLWNLKVIARNDGLKTKVSTAGSKKDQPLCCS